MQQTAMQTLISEVVQRSSGAANPAAALYPRNVFWNWRAPAVSAVRLCASAALSQ